MLTTVRDVQCDENGRPYSWIIEGTLGDFWTAQDAIAYIDANWHELQDKDIRFFTGSASATAAMNAYLDKKRADLTKLKEVTT